MRILFIATAYPSSFDDARGAHIHRLAQALVKRGHTVTVVAPARLRSERIVVDGVNLVLFRYWLLSRRRVASGVGGIIPAVRQRPSLCLQLIPLVFMMARSVRIEINSHDIVHSHWIVPSALVVRVLGKRCDVATAHGADVNMASKSPLGRFLLRFSLGSTGVASAVSDDLAEQLRVSGCQRVEVTPLGVEVPPVENRPEADFDAVFVGSLTPRKNVGLALRALELLEQRGLNISFLVVGDGPMRQELEMAAEKLESTVRFVGEVESVKAVEFIGRSKCLVLPSISEGRPTVVLEAMANGAVVIASNIAGTREMVKDGATGLLFQSGSDIQLADCLEYTLKNDQRAGEIRHAARGSLFVNEWTIDDASVRFEALYQRALVAAGASC